MSDRHHATHENPDQPAKHVHNVVPNSPHMGATGKGSPAPSPTDPPAAVPVNGDLDVTIEDATPADTATNTTGTAGQQDTTGNGAS